MAGKITTVDFPASLSGDGWFVPTDYVIMKPGFKKQLAEACLDGLAPESIIVDLNAGTEGPGAAVIAAGHHYTTLEQNPLLRAEHQAAGFETKDWRPPRMPLADADTDRVVSCAFLEHMPTWTAAMEVMLDIHRVLRPRGRLILCSPNAPGCGQTFYDDYKHGWYVSRKRLIDMALECGYEVHRARYTIGWITMLSGPKGAIMGIAARSVMAVLNFSPMTRLLEGVGLEPLAAKVRKTLFELVVIELRKPS